jgi:hypothetical protein
MKHALLCTTFSPALFAACAHAVTATGVTECFTTWYVIGVYHGCGHGPEWAATVHPNPASPSADVQPEMRPAMPPSAAPSSYCFTKTGVVPPGEGQKGCGATRDDCEAKLSAYLAGGGTAGECKGE